MIRSALFVGNSYTFYNDVPGQVAALAAAAGRELEVATVAEGGAHVQLHWESTGARERIEAGGYDVLVLQDQSGGPLHDQARFERYAPMLAEAALSTGAQVLWYQPWGRADGHPAYDSKWSGGSRGEMTRRLGEAYEDMARRVGGDIARVGAAWLRALEMDETLPLYDEDLHHAAPAGSHLAALVIGHALLGLDPREAAFCPGDVDEDVARTLRAAAAASLEAR